ncbi:MAG: hypothetical protein JJV95_01965 [Sulfurospirillum sp.]|nr:hypothetical protein [Sulfurospirillum sp.]MBL0702737.1 hypothetical protein [Sulfurospirillum sp.]
MYKFFIVLILLLFFTGCYQKKIDNIQTISILHGQILTQTKKNALKKEDETKVFFVTTYMNNLDNNPTLEDKKFEKFIVGVYIPKDKKKYNSLFFKINSKEPTSIEELKKDNELLHLLPASNPWGKYYMVKAPVDNDIEGVSFEVGITDIGSEKIEFNDQYGNIKQNKVMGFETNANDQ